MNKTVFWIRCLNIDYLDRGDHQDTLVPALPSSPADLPRECLPIRWAVGRVAINQNFVCVIIITLVIMVTFVIIMIVNVNPKASNEDEF